MTNSNKFIEYPPFGIRTLALLLLSGILLIMSSYLWVDQPIAWWAYQHHFRDILLFKYITYLPEILTACAFLYYFYFILKLLTRKISLLDDQLLCIANSIAIVTFLKSELKFVFGRYWPMTWTDQNPSLIKDHAYGFHFFHQGSAFGSFPSGHTAVIVAIATTLWMLWPRFRWIYASAAIAVMMSLIAANYHFVADVLGGSVIGVLTGIGVSTLQQIKQKSQKSL